MSETAPSGRVLCDVQHIARRFGATQVLVDVAFSIQPAERILLLGANGSGKSTLLRILAGISLADSGTVRWHDDVVPGYLSQDLQAYSALTVEENLSFFHSLGSMTAPDFPSWGLTEYRNRMLSALSKGLQQRVNLCRVFAESRSFLLLDEPTTYLDAPGVGRFQYALSQAGNSGVGFVLASHDLTHVHELASRAILLSAGRVMLDSIRDDVSLDMVLTAYREVNK